MPTPLGSTGVACGTLTGVVALGPGRTRSSCGGVAQLGERYNRTVEVRGSNPRASTTSTMTRPLRAAFSYVGGTHSTHDDVAAV